MCQASYRLPLNCFLLSLSRTHSHRSLILSLGLSWCSCWVFSILDQSFQKVWNPFEKQDFASRSRFLVWFSEGTSASQQATSEAPLSSFLILLFRLLKFGKRKATGSYQPEQEHCKKEQPKFRIMPLKFTKLQFRTQQGA